MDAYPSSTFCFISFLLPRITLAICKCAEVCTKSNTSADPGRFGDGANSTDIHAMISGEGEEIPFYKMLKANSRAEAIRNGK